MTHCAQTGGDYQPFPRTGRLAENTNLSLDGLRARVLPGPAKVYCYIVATVENRRGRLVQTGSGPNWQGDLITLCTCKHWMRAFMNADAWRGVWIAGFTGVRAGSGLHHLVYLMRVKQAFRSHHDLWFAKSIAPRTKEAKAAHLSKFGDLYKPRQGWTDPFDPRGYAPPEPDHVHCNLDHWHNDIDYVGLSGRRPALLAGDPAHSYLWDRPTVLYPARLHRGQKKHSLDDLLALVQTA